MDINPSSKSLTFLNKASALPLCVDLDGTLIYSDLLLESFLLLIKKNPFYSIIILYNFFQGKAALKAYIAKNITINPALLPYNITFLNWVKEQKTQGRSVWLCTASNEKLAYSISNYLKLFSGTFASSDTINLSGEIKSKRLVEQFGEKAFDYCGNHLVDLAVWKKSHTAIIVNSNNDLIKNTSNHVQISKIFPSKKISTIKLFCKALRLHQWIKNILIFLPLIAAHQWLDLHKLYYAFLAFLSFSLIASSVYVVNDMFDLENDRLHPRKKNRPFASGDLSLMYGLISAPVLFIIACSIAQFLPISFIAILFSYYILTFLYSLRLKRIVLVDTIVLATLYTSRIIAGGLALNIYLSFWLLTFSIFLFLSLSFVKRYAELKALQLNSSQPLKTEGRDYHTDDMPIIHSYGVSSGYLSVLVLALYINSPIVVKLYRYPERISFLCVLLLYWISWIWLQTHRGNMDDDPLIFALKDKVSLIVLALSIITILYAL
ncbi:MAG: UbiA family prenyltransferase [Pseudomonadota bacterium]